jgi:hypothetical protein
VTSARRLADPTFIGVGSDLAFLAGAARTAVAQLRDR